MTTFDEHSRDEVFRDYLRHATEAETRAKDAGNAAVPAFTEYHIGRGQIHATLAHAAATLLAAMPEPLTARYVFPSEITAERDALRDRVDELVAQGLTEYKDAGRVVAQTGSMPEKHEPGTEPLCTCGHHVDRHFDGPRSMRAMCDDCECECYTPSTAPLCTCGHHVDRHYAAAGHCRDCTCTTYVPNTTEVDGWSEPDARGARFRVARFEQNGHVPPVYFKVTDQLGILATREFKYEDSAQAVAEDLNRKFVSASTETSVETEAQPESPAMALVRAMHAAVISLDPPSGFVTPGEASRVATIVVLRALAPMMRDDADSAGIREMATELEQHTDTPTTE